MSTSSSKKDLIDLCKEKGIRGYSKKTKKELAELLSSPHSSPMIIQKEIKSSLIPESRHISVEMKVPLNQDTGKFRTNTKDQFYTNEHVAKLCIQRVLNVFPFTEHYLWIEPSAGNGSFLHNIPSTIENIGLDIEPKTKDIVEQDYLKWIPPSNKDMIVVGNPPFGRQSSLAKAFISKSCEFAKIIAFILPKSFTKPSMFNVFDLKFHLMETMELEKDSFVLNGSKYHVPCVFQIWKKTDQDRSVEKKINPVGFVYVKSTEKYHIAFRRVGGLAGKCYKNDGTDFSIQSHYFIKLDDDMIDYTDFIIRKINSHIFPSNTVGPRSLSKSETNIVLNDIIHSVSSS